MTEKTLHSARLDLYVTVNVLVLYGVRLNLYVTMQSELRGCLARSTLTNVDLVRHCEVRVMMKARYYVVSV
jgi:hypothetical protein